MKQMGHHNNKNYTKYSEKSNNNVDTTSGMEVNSDIISIDESDELIYNEQPVESVDNVNSNENVDIDASEPNDSICDDNTVETMNDNNSIKTCEGIVTGCSKLYIRKESLRKSDPVGMVNENDRLLINLDESTEDFYKVESPLQGYCMKTYVNIIQE